MSEEKIPLKYRWRQTWADHPNDFVGFDPSSLDQHGKPETIGRFYLSHLPDGMAWRWFSQWRAGENSDTMPSGVAATEREAARAIEGAYEALRAAETRKEPPRG